MAPPFEYFYRVDGDFPVPSEETKFPTSISPDECKWILGTPKHHYDTLVAWRADVAASSDSGPWSTVCMD